MPGDKISALETLLFGAFAGTGGILSYMMRMLSREKKPRIGASIVEGLSSAFVGVLAMLACKALNLDWYWSGVIVGVFGWIGAEASIAMLTKLVRKRLGVDDNVGKNP
ncbi:MAG: phage holin family protein [Rickettsiales bacterium]